MSAIWEQTAALFGNRRLNIVREVARKEGSSSFPNADSMEFEAKFGKYADEKSMRNLNKNIGDIDSPIPR